MTIKALAELGLSIPLLTIYGVSCIYFYELGFFQYFKIPKEFIQIEFFKNIFLLFAFVIFLLGIIVLVIFIIDFLPLKVSKSERNQIILLFVAFPFIVYCAITRNDVNMLSFTALVSVFFILYGQKGSELYWIFTNYDPNHYKLIRAIFFSFLIISISGMGLYILGELSAKDDLSIIKKVSSNFRLIRNYDDYILYGRIDSLTHKVSTLLLERTSTGIVDTFFIHVSK